MIPYLRPPVLALGRLEIHAFSILLVAGIVCGRFIFLRRARSEGMDTARLDRLFVWMLAAGFAGAHIPRLVITGHSVIPAGISSFGGFAGAIAVAAVWLPRHRYSVVDSLRTLDLLGYAAPFSCAIARLGCALAHDHRGFRTSSWIGVRFPGGSQYDLGLIECVFLVALSTMVYGLGRVRRPAGFFFGLFGVTYGLFRIWLDTLHADSTQFTGGAVTMLIGLLSWAAMAYVVRENGDESSGDATSNPCGGGLADLRSDAVAD